MFKRKIIKDLKKRTFLSKENHKKSNVTLSLISFWKRETVNTAHPVFRTFFILKEHKGTKS
jgi:hypothetical protein